MGVPAALLLAVSLVASSAAGATISADWAAGGTTADLGGVTVSMTGLSSPSVISSGDFDDPPFELTGSDYAAAPLPGATELTSYGAQSDWTATFSPPVSDLLLYLVFWRGVAGVVDPATAVIYTFDQPFTVLSGLAGASVSGGNTVLTAPRTAFHNGILQFAGPVSSLSLTSDAIGNAQALTFGVVPEPSTGLLFGAALAALACASLRRHPACSRR